MIEGAVYLLIAITLFLTVVVIGAVVAASLVICLLMLASFLAGLWEKYVWKSKT